MFGFMEDTRETGCYREKERQRERRERREREKETERGEKETEESCGGDSNSPETIRLGPPHMNNAPREREEDRRQKTEGGIEYLETLSCPTCLFSCVSCVYQQKCEVWHSKQEHT